MRTLLIGHRGVGKTNLLARIHAYRNSSVFDLDELIMKGEGQSVTELFEQRGEAQFRELERKYLSQALLFDGRCWIAIGAGFQFAEFNLPADVSVCWVRRPTDANGRIFLNRPRLNATTSALDEYLERFEKRNESYAKVAHETLVLDEGFDFENEPERRFITNEISNVGFDLTILPSAFARDFDLWVTNRLSWGVRFFELRDDLLSATQIRHALKMIPHRHLLYSFRSLAALAESREILAQNSDVAFDWAHELGTFHGPRQPGFFSFHHRGEMNLDHYLKTAESLQLASPSTLLKIALPIENFDELSRVHDWMMQNPVRRIVLPMSKTGRWSWYRLWQQRRLKLNFMREDMGSVPDQPTLLQVLRAQQTPAPSNFAAVLGQPVNHSRTPAEQGKYFAKRGWPVYQIDVAEEEWEMALPFLRRLGLKAAAVTSPLKLKALASSASLTDTAREMGAVNTLWFGDKVVGHNTDKQGFISLFDQAREQSSVGVWGGGGTLELIRKLSPGVQEYSARTGQRRDGQPSTPPDVLIWAVPRSRFSGNWPTWNPKTIIDLNYGDDSPARELALRSGACYVSGLAMFKAQAQGQRDFWKLNEESENGGK